MAQKRGFEYCECGCHGHQWRDFWLFNDLKGTFYLHQGHGWLSPLIGKFKSFKEAESHAFGIARKEAKQILEECGNEA